MQVKLQDIKLTYEKHHNIFERLNCTFNDGELVALLGPSGSGKTTMLNLIAGLLTPTTGKILFNESDVTKQDVRARNIGMVFQDYALYPHLSVLDNIAFPFKMAHVKKSARRKQAQKLAKLVHVETQLAKLPRELSGGQQQRAAIARALAKDPAILLLDEPLSNLDATLRIELRDEIRRIQQTTGVTTVFVTHDQSDALQIADKIIVLANGQIQQIGTGTELYHHPHNLFVAQFVGTPKINLIPIAEFKPYITPTIPDDILVKATTIGIRSEAVSLNSIEQPVIAKIPAIIEKQNQFGREIRTHICFQTSQLISTAISETTASSQAISVYVLAKGCYLFNRDGECIWAGDEHD
ncbi:Putrescine transport ATP-binding protein PotA [Pediococcus damnosus]|uniref:ABC transporter ATP-binding protein n=1 Tax=Pediococcus damnosus TaxID=51663 RepID=UPI00078E7CAB|nr:ABC transporter ATP-binding protein [Pediococcus damnosus]AMV60398.1 Putrescine transport ATP-binding protein PotA [Pediococcus damnosus]